jgi:xylulokinase
MPDFLPSKFSDSKWLAPEMFFLAIDEALTRDSEKFGSPKHIYLSGQMHGATLCNADTILPLVPISTWQDRAAKSFDRGRRWQEVQNALNDKLRTATGNELDYGHPVVVLPFLLSQLEVGSESLRFTSLISLVAEHLVGHPVTSHVSDAAASGMYDPFNGSWVPELVALAQIGNAQLPETSESIEIVGHTPEGALVYTGVGDHQASLLGGESKNVDSDFEICINVGTGAQVSSLLPKLDSPHRLRPKLGGGFFATVPDLPAGRELSENQVTFDQAAQAYLKAAQDIHLGEIKSVALTGSIFSSAPLFAQVIAEVFDAPARITKGEPALSGLARLAD